MAKFSTAREGIMKGALPGRSSVELSVGGYEVAGAPTSLDAVD